MEMSVGQYVENDSIIHKMDPRVKIFANITLIILVFISKTYLAYGIIFLPVILTYLFSKLQIRKLISMIKPVIFICVFLFLINIFIVKMDVANDVNIAKGWFSPIAFWSGRIVLSDVALDRTLTIAARVYMMIIITTILTSTTKPFDLTKGLEDIMFPLKIIKFPVHIVAMIISIALRFIPTLLEEAQRIMKAQASRGVDFKNGGFKAKVKSTITLIIPLFVTSFSKAEDLGNAMETRGYEPYAKRTRYRQFSIKFIDIFALFIVVALTVTISCVLGKVFETPSWWM